MPCRTAVLRPARSIREAALSTFREGRQRCRTLLADVDLGDGISARRQRNGSQRPNCRDRPTMPRILRQPASPAQPRDAGRNCPDVQVGALSRGHPTRALLWSRASSGPPRRLLRQAVLQSHTGCRKRLGNGLLHLIQDCHCSKCDHNGRSTTEQKRLHAQTPSLAIHTHLTMPLALSNCDERSEIRLPFLPALRALSRSIEDRRYASRLPVWRGAV